MINVVFLLLIFFMVAGIVRTSDPLPLKAPESTVESPVIAESVLFVAGDGVLMLDDTSVSMASLEANLSKLKALAINSNTPSSNANLEPMKDVPGQPNDKPLLAIKADAQVTVSLLRDIMDVVRDAGLLRVELITSWAPVENR